jgi:hypothetical protein
MGRSVIIFSVIALFCVWELELQLFAAEQCTSTHRVSTADSHMSRDCGYQIWCLSVGYLKQESQWKWSTCDEDSSLLEKARVAGWAVSKVHHTVICKSSGPVKTCWTTWSLEMKQHDSSIQQEPLTQWQSVTYLKALIHSAVTVSNLATFCSHDRLRNQ